VPVDTLGRIEFRDAARSPDPAPAIVTADPRTSTNSAADHRRPR
jgi:L-fucose mutarotase